MGKSIHLTAKGEAFVENYIQPLSKAEQRAIGAFSDDEVQAFLSVFRRVVTCLDTEISKEKENFADVQ